MPVPSSLARARLAAPEAKLQATEKLIGGFEEELEARRQAAEAEQATAAAGQTPADMVRSRSAENVGPTTRANLEKCLELPVAGC